MNSHGFRPVAALALLFILGAASEELQALGINQDGSPHAYYDTQQNISWLADANYAGYSAAIAPIPGVEIFWKPGWMTGAPANEWATSLDIGGGTGSRLSSRTLKTDLYREACNYHSCTLGSSELGHGFTALGDTTTPENTGPFINIQAAHHLGIRGDGGDKGLGIFGSGAASLVTETGSYSAAARPVHDGDMGVMVAAIPQPATYALMLAGLYVFGIAVLAVVVANILVKASAVSRR